MCHRLVVQRKKKEIAIRPYSVCHSEITYTKIDSFSSYNKIQMTLFQC